MVEINLTSCPVFREGLTKSVNSFTHLIFFWCLGGVALIYGVRLFHDMPIHPSFIPIVGATFAAILSFTLVVAFRIYAGPIDFESEKIKLKGATGPIVLWCICFLSVSYGLYLLGMGDVAKSSPATNYHSYSTWNMLFGKSTSDNQTSQPKSPDSAIQPTSSTLK